MIRNRFVLLLDLLLIILSVLGSKTVTSRCETDKRMARIVSVYPLCEAIRWSFPLILEQLGDSKPEHATRPIHLSSFFFHLLYETP